MGVKKPEFSCKFYMKNISEKILVSLLETMLKIRMFEEKIVELYPAQDMRTPVHLYIGQEAIASGVCANLKKDDYLFTNHRCHGHLIAKGSDLKPLIAELYGKKTGCSKGKAGSMHLIAPEIGILATSAIVGGGIPLAVGTALASKLKKDNRISVVFFGDGAADTGSFYQSLNFASLHKLPVVFICENNLYATQSPIKARQVNTDIYRKASVFKMHGERIDGNDVIAVYESSKKAVKKAREKKEPSLIECITYRIKPHVGPDSDINSGYRSKSEHEKWLKKCPIKIFTKFLLDKKIISEQQINKIKNSIAKKIDSALSFSRNSPIPSKNESLKDVY